MGNGEHDLPFKIELWDDADRHIEEVIALASDYASAWQRGVKRGLESSSPERGAGEERSDGPLRKAFAASHA